MSSPGLRTFHICWIDDKKSHLKHVLCARKVQNFSDFKFSKVMQQHI